MEANEGPLRAPKCGTVLPLGKSEFNQEKRATAGNSWGKTCPSPLSDLHGMIQHWKLEPGSLHVEKSLQRVCKREKRECGFGRWMITVMKMRNSTGPVPGE